MGTHTVSKPPCSCIKGRRIGVGHCLSKRFCKGCESATGRCRMYNGAVEGRVEVMLLFLRLIA
jgi:hypothetical protein